MRLHLLQWIVLFAAVELAGCGFIRSCRAYTVDQILDAIERVETGGRDVTGDDGRSLGSIQIGRGCWRDSGVGGRWQDCHRRSTAMRVAIAYLSRWEPRAVYTGDYSALARCWNAGPNWRRHRHATDRYVGKVKAELRRMGR